mmetsp:Transcript_17535/g.21227  ORF Transcript_17535/g.21227 Transcript_17535/m.21227 type:complete len:220 (+) Transcript_17535:323-982(+)
MDETEGVGAYSYQRIPETSEVRERDCHSEREGLLDDSSSDEQDNSRRARNSLSSSGSNQSVGCRICGDGLIAGAESDPKWQLISPCNCKGSLARVHVKCLETWILTRPRGQTTGDVLQCEICASKYGVSLVRRLKCDVEHICSWSTLAHFIEGCTLLLCIGCVFYILVALFPAISMAKTSPSERIALIAFLAFLSMICLCALSRLFKRWHRQISVPSIV